MKGNETEYLQTEDGWEAREGEHIGMGRTKEEAASALLEVKATHISPTVSEQTVENKAVLTEQIAATVSRLVIRRLKNTTKEGMVFVAFRSDKSEVQGYGRNESEAKVDLFKKEQHK